MKRNEAIIVVFGIATLFALGSGLLYLSVTSGAVAGTVEGASNESVAAAQPTVTAQPTVSEPTTTEDARGEVLVRGENVLNASYNEEDGGLVVEFRATGDDWQVNIYRSGVSLTTLVPEEHTDKNGNVHPTTAYWNQNASLPESKSYAFIGSRIDSGADTEATDDDEYVVTVVLPTVVSENVRFTLVEGENVNTFYEGEY